MSIPNNASRTHNASHAHNATNLQGVADVYERSAARDLPHDRAQKKKLIRSLESLCINEALKLLVRC